MSPCSRLADGWPCAASRSTVPAGVANVVRGARRPGSATTESGSLRRGGDPFDARQPGSALTGVVISNTTRGENRRRARRPLRRLRMEADLVATMRSMRSSLYSDIPNCPEGATSVTQQAEARNRAQHESPAVERASGPGRRRAHRRSSERNAGAHRPDARTRDRVARGDHGRGGRGSRGAKAACSGTTATARLPRSASCSTGLRSLTISGRPAPARESRAALPS